MWIKKARIENAAALSAEDKIEVLEQLENKSAREGEKFLLSLNPGVTVPRERERMISETQAEVRFVMDETLRQNLERVRSLLGLKGLDISISELTNEMALMSIRLLEQKSFGKKRVEKSLSTSIVDQNSKAASIVDQNSKAASMIDQNLATARPEKRSGNYISKSLKFRIWQRDQGQCTLCFGKRNLNFDHIQPKALGGENIFENLRLLCFHCNQRRAFQTFGRKL